MRRLQVFVALCICLVPGVAWAQGSPDEVARRVSEEIMSPFCDGVTLHDCPSAEADDLRLEISTWARAGMTEEQIVARLEERYGSVISGSPSSPFAWVVPFLGAAVGVVLVAILARRWRGSPGYGHDGSPPGLPLAPEDRARLDAELAGYRRKQ
jgi:cytochrome c-type biogenesis protein CcmH/NrfF